MPSHTDTALDITMPTKSFDYPVTQTRLDIHVILLNTCDQPRHVKMTKGEDKF